MFRWTMNGRPRPRAPRPALVTAFALAFAAAAGTMLLPGCNEDDCTNPAGEVPAGIIAGRILGGDGSGVHPASINAERLADPARPYERTTVMAYTDSSGAYSIPVPAGNWVCRLSTAGFVGNFRGGTIRTAERDTFAIADGTTLRQDIRMAGVRVELTIPAAEQARAVHVKLGGEEGCG